MNSVKNQTMLVLQGEIGIVQHTKSNPTSTLTSSAPYCCHVLTLYDSKQKIAVMTHIDNLTSVSDIFNKIDLLWEKQFPSILKAEIFGGNSKESSQAMLKNVESCLKARKIAYKHTPFAGESCFIPKPHVSINVLNGKISKVIHESIINPLDSFQRNEYALFKHFVLGSCMKRIKKGEPLSFKVKKASRFSNILENHYNTFYCMSRLIKQPKGEYNNEKDDCFCGCAVLNAKTIKTLLAQFKNFSGMSKLIKLSECEYNNEKYDFSCGREVINAKTIKTDLGQLIGLPTLKNKNLTASLKNENFNLMLRLSAVHEKFLRLTRFLLTYRALLKIDIRSKGKKSGTALDVATKKNNKKAAMLLKQYSSLL